MNLLDYKDQLPIQVKLRNGQLATVTQFSSIGVFCFSGETTNLYGTRSWASWQANGAWRNKDVPSSNDIIEILTPLKQESPMQIYVTLPSDTPLPPFEVERYEYREPQLGEHCLRGRFDSSVWCEADTAGGNPWLIAIPKEAPQPFSLPAEVEKHGLPLVCVQRDGGQCVVTQDIHTLLPQCDYRWRGLAEDGDNITWAEEGHCLLTGDDNDLDIVAIYKDQPC